MGPHECLPFPSDQETNFAGFWRQDVQNEVEFHLSPDAANIPMTAKVSEEKYYFIQTSKTQEGDLYLTYVSKQGVVLMILKKSTNSKYEDFELLTQHEDSQKIPPKEV